MFYKHFSFQITIRLLAINALAFLLYHLIQKGQTWLSISGLALALLACTISLFRYTSQVREDLQHFMLAIKNRDSTLNFKNRTTSSSFPELYAAFGEIISIHRQIEMEKEGALALLRTVLQQVPVGVIVLHFHPIETQQTELVIFNEAAASLLDTPAYRYWHRLARHVPQFSSEVEQIWKGGKRFIELKIQDKFIQLSTELIPLVLSQHNYAIISFQDIKDEIERKESEAWNRLIGVISHEILNSITPISSLSDTINDMIDTKSHLNPEELNELKPALSAIRRRSAGLLDFVQDYRLIAELPSPQLQEHTLGEILQHLQILMEPLAKEKNVILTVVKTSARLSLPIDLKLIEQAMINLVTNSIYATEGIDNATVSVGYKLEKQKLYIEVCDNGRGIQNDIREKIFVPFFSTREEGSGIGLTITRNIMKMHQGNVEVQSVPYESTTFSLVFNLMA